MVNMSPVLQRRTTELLEESSNDSIPSTVTNESELEVSKNDDGEAVEIESLRNRAKEIEEEAEKIKQLEVEVDRQLTLGEPESASQGGGPTSGITMGEKIEIDNRSIYVGNVDYGATASELENHFHGCGAINRVTILCNKYDGHPKGFAYIEFCEKESVQTAMALDESIFKGRQIKVMPKRTNRPGLSTTHRPPRGTRMHQTPRFFRALERGYNAGFQPMRRPVQRRGIYYTPY